jgi:hypothetical protein
MARSMTNQQIASIDRLRALHHESPRLYMVKVRESRTGETRWYRIFAVERDYTLQDVTMLVNRALIHIGDEFRSDRLMRSQDAPNLEWRLNRFMQGAKLDRTFSIEVL